MYSKNEEWLEMLNSVIQEYTGCESVVCDITTEYDNEDKEDAYIDHQSAFPDNTEMFDSRQNLVNFIFNNSSFIQGGNDNV